MFMVTGMTGGLSRGGTGMKYEPITVMVAEDGAADFVADLPRVMKIYKILIITWDSTIDTNLCYEPEGNVVCSGDIGTVLRFSEKQHYELIAITWPDLFCALREPRGLS